MAVKTKGLVPRLWRRTKRVLIVLFLLHFVYILILKWVDPPITLTQIGSLFRGDGLKRDYIDIEDISPYAKLAFIAAEDQKFPDHNGFDWKSIGKAMDYNKRNPNKVRGASTISQQVAKNVFLWQGRSKFRKALETYFTFMCGASKEFSKCILMFQKQEREFSESRRHRMQCLRNLLKN
jgi:monofunctional biosynthetic peptidoglycan transglycosylase